MSLKIGNKSKLVYDWSLSVFGGCDCVVQLVLDLVFFDLVVLCFCFCVFFLAERNCQMDLPNKLTNRIAESNR
jgi:hypothetical protein